MLKHQKILIDEMDDGMDEKLNSMGFDAYSVKKLRGDGKKLHTDYSIINYAKENNMILVTRDTESGQACMENNLPCILLDNNEILKIVVILIVMIYTDFKLTIVSLSSIPILLIATSWFKRSIKSAFQQVRTQVSIMNAFIQEHIVGMNIVQIFVREKAEYQKFKKINKAHQDAHIRSILYYSIFFPVVEILSATSIGLIIWWGGSAILSGQDITFGELVAFILYIHMLFRPIRQLADRFNILQMGIVGSERVFKILDTDQKIKDNSDLVLEQVKGDITFNKTSIATPLKAATALLTSSNVIVV